jgi:hypothetical protein
MSAILGMSFGVYSIYGSCVPSAPFKLMVNLFFTVHNGAKTIKFSLFGSVHSAY